MCFGLTQSVRISSHTIVLQRTRVCSTKKVEYRGADPSSNPYLAFACLLAAGLDGVKKKLDPGDPVDEDIYKLSAEKRK